MTLTALILLTLQTLLGALDNVLHHELTERLPSKPSARRELALHSAREAIYGILFLVFAWLEPTGLFAFAVLALLATEVAITIADFLEEDRTRRLPPFERVLHTVLAVLYGGFLGAIVPWLIAQAAAPSGIALTSHGLFSWFFTLAAVGVLAFAIRNALAVRALGMTPPRAADLPMSGRTVLVTGATGFIGSALVARLLARGDRVFALTRDARQSRTLLGDRVRHVESLETLPRETRIDAVVNLAGAPVLGLPWTPGRRAVLLRSRADLTRRLVEWLTTLQHRPKVLVNGSAIGFYGDRGDAMLTEVSGAGQGFAPELCQAWEQAALRAESIGMRVVCLRTGLVLDAAGGSLPMMALPIRLGAGAVLGHGRQWMSWITRNDLLRMIVTAIDDERWSGAINAVAPEALRHREFQSALARTLRRPMLLRAPAWGIRLALGEMSSILLDSQRVVPAKAMSIGFAFDVHFAADALSQLLGPPLPALPSLETQESEPAPELTVVSSLAQEDRPARRQKRAG